MSKVDRVETETKDLKRLERELLARIEEGYMYTHTAGSAAEIEYEEMILDEIANSLNKRSLPWVETKTS